MRLPVLDNHAPAAPEGAMPVDRAAIARDLANAIQGEVRFNPHDRLLYGTDASLYQVEPIGVVIPRDIDDAARALAFCARHGLPVLPRGGGTSLAGQCTANAVVVDLSPNCRGILEVDAAACRARVEPGITVDDLNDELTRRGGQASTLFFAPDPATSRHATIGGCIGNNAAGGRSILFGRTAESLLGADVALATGERLTLDEGAALRDPRVRALTEQVLRIVLPRAAIIRERFPRTIRRNAGYGLDMIARQALGDSAPSTDAHVTDAMLARVNLSHLICGSEGTLAMVLGAQLHLHAKPRAKGLAVLGYDSLDAAIDSVVPILSLGPSAVELLDDLVISLARANTEYGRYVDLMPQPPGRTLNSVLYVEFFAESSAQIEAKFAALADLARTLPGAPALARHTDAQAMLKAWKLRKAGEPLLHGIPGHRKPITFVEDNAVPVENLSRFVREFRSIVERHGTRAAFWAHASVGVLHVRPLLDLHDHADRERMQSIAVEVADLARSLGGVMSGEHGDGRVRGPLLERFFGAEIMQAFREVKHAFDPAGLLNPGNIVPSAAEPRLLGSIVERLRIEPTPARPVPVPDADTFFDYTDAHGFDSAVEMCNGAGVCRKKQGGTMCPSYMATLDERHSTRGRGNALRLAITGQFSSDCEGQASGAARWSDPGTIETLNLCLSCKACKTECPSNVDIARLKAEYTAQRFRAEGTPLAARLLGAVRSLNRAGSTAPRLANWLARTSLARAITTRLFNFDPRRSLPEFAPSLASTWKHARAAPGTRTIALFGDCFTMHNEPGIGHAARAVLEACGYRVLLADAGCCARAKISLGLLPQAIEEIDATLDALSVLVEDEGIEAILVAEPSCLSAIKDDWLALNVRTPRSTRERIAALSFLPEDFVEQCWDAHPRRPAFRPLPPDESVVLHGHCHQKALWGAETSAKPLQRACGGRADAVRTLDSGCCGMAGSFGFTADRYDLSMRIGELTLLPAVRSAGPRTTIAAPGTSCRHQIKDGAGVHALHPIEILAQRLDSRR